MIFEQDQTGNWRPFKLKNRLCKSERFVRRFGGELEGLHFSLPQPMIQNKSLGRTGNLVCHRERKGRD